MRTRIIAVVAGLAVCLVGATAAFAQGGATKASSGKLSAYSYNKNNKTGWIKIKVKGKKPAFRLVKTTMCGVSYGQMGDEVPCSTFAKSKFRNKTFTVQWTRHGKYNVAAVVSVYLPR